MPPARCTKTVHNCSQHTSPEDSTQGIIVDKRDTAFANASACFATSGTGADLRDSLEGQEHAGKSQPAMLCDAMSCGAGIVWHCLCLAVVVANAHQSTA